MKVIAAVERVHAGPHGPVPAVEAHVSRAGRFRGYLLIGPLLIFLGIFVWLIALQIPQFSGPSGAGYGSDFAVFYEAATVLKAGHNPYDANLLWRSERADFRRAGLEIPHNQALVRVGNPPLLFWLLRQLSALPFRLAGILWTVAMYLLSLAGFVVLLWRLGWTRTVLPAAVFMAMPQVVLGSFYGDIIGLIFAAVAVSIAIAERYPALAGALLGVCWLKPHVGLPAALLVWAFHARSRRQLAAAFVGVSVLLGTVMVAAVGAAGVHEWITGLTGWTRDITGQPEMASFAGLYYRWAPGPLRISLEVLAVAAAIAATALTWRRFQRDLPDPVSVGWLWGLWLLCAPYAHINDAMLLALPVLALVGRNGLRLLSPPSLLIVYLLCACLALNRLPGMPIDLQPIKLAAVVAILAWVAWRSQLRERRYILGFGSSGSSG